MRCAKRAEKIDPDRLVDTFVQEGSLFARLSSRDHQVLFGRRGTGKTHALKYLARTLASDGHVAVYVDLQTIGSTGGLYSDPTVPVSEAGTRLLVDALAAVHDQLVDYALAASEQADMDTTLLLLDRLADDITTITVRGDEKHTVRIADISDTGTGAELGASLAASGPRITAKARASTARKQSVETSVQIRGSSRHHVHFGAVSKTVRLLVDSLPGQQLWVLLDEWTDVPKHLQPLLADLLRRSLFPIRGVTVKIAALEQRSRFWAEREGGGYIGIELGADAAADVDFDDFMVFANDRGRAIEFFARLLARHSGVFMPESLRWNSTEGFLDTAFVQGQAFSDLVQAAEGVPRDAINIVAGAASRAGESRIVLKDVREAARAWYLRDKEKPLSEKQDARLLLHWIVDRVIGDRQSRGFLLEQGTHDELIDWLYDARVLHIIKRGIASKSHPGLRFDAFALDYGCYIDLLATTRAPRGLFETTDESFTEVPPDDADLIRGAVLNLQDFYDEQQLITAPGAELEWTSPEAVRSYRLVGDADVLAWLLLEVDGDIAAVALKAGRYLIGCGRHCDVRLVHPSVAANHGTLTVEGDATMSVVSGRTNRTYVNNQRVVRRRLEQGDELRLGDLALTVVLKVDVEDPQPPARTAPEAQQRD
jgi:hypothetical protein